MDTGYRLDSISEVFAAVFAVILLYSALADMSKPSFDGVFV